MHRYGKWFGSCVMVAVLTMIGTAWGQDIKDRMRDRLPAIIELKAKGVAGENNQGFLEVLNGNAAQQALVAAENLDRRAIYEQIARQTGTSVQIVGQRRAAQIAEKAAAGEWLQDAAGKWYQK